MQQPTIDLSGLWRFQVDVYRQGRTCEWFASDVETRFWREVAVPGTFEQYYPDLANYEGCAWLTRRFDVPADWAGKSVTLRFEGVCARATVWLNGCEVGTIPDSYLRADLSSGDALNVGGSNTLAVEVDNARVAGDVPGTQYGWRPFGGILRDVSLIATDPLQISHVQTAAEADGAIRQTIDVDNARGESTDASVEVLVRSAEGKELAVLTSDHADVPGGGQHRFDLSGRVQGAEPWTPEHPALYQADVRLLAGGQLVDAQTVRIGFRTIRAEGVKLLLNGEPIFLKGFNRHEDSPRTNGCPDPETLRHDLEMMKSAGCNFIRLCHYPHDPAELDLCDEMGLLAIAEIPLYWCSGVDGETPNIDDSRRAARRQLTAMIRRDCNHPSVIFWSVSNETHEGEPTVVELNRELIQLARSLDSSRLIGHASNCWKAHPHFEDDDVIFINDYPTWWQLAGGKSKVPDYAWSTKAWTDHLAELHGVVGDRPILITEFGGMSLSGVGGCALGEDVHAAIIEAEYAGISCSPYACGATVWCWADHLWPHNTWMCNLHISPFGAVTRQRRPKQPYWAAARCFAEPKPAAPAPVPAPAEPPAETSHGWGVVMVRTHLRDIPQVPPPEGFTIRGMRPHEEALWADIWRDADTYITVGDNVFPGEFGADPGAWQRRVLLMLTPRGQAVGTLSAWYDRNFLGQDYGRIHWFAIRREYQGKGLSRPMMTEAMNRLAAWHERATLGTQTKRVGAIKIYLDYGFVPLIQSEQDRQHWDVVRGRLDHPGLDAAVDTQEGNTP